MHMFHRIITAVCLGVLVQAGCNSDKGAPKTGPTSTGAFQSGPQVGADVPGPFHPLNVTGASAGKKNCLFCENGSNPVAMIFARSTSPELTDLIKKIDASTAQHSHCKMGSFVVFLSDADGLRGELEELAKKEKLRNCVLSIDNPAGPSAYKVAKDAEVTVVLYTDHTVKANYAFKKGKMKGKDAAVIVAEVSKILPQK
jgi:hypothetical protein